MLEMDNLHIKLSFTILSTLCKLQSKLRQNTQKIKIVFVVLEQKKLKIDYKY